MQAAHAKELSGKSTKVAGLELIVKELNTAKQQQFETLERKQAEVETSRAEMETLQNRTKELEFQLREASERSAMLEEQVQVSNSPVRGRHLGVGLGIDSRRSTPDPSPSRQNSYNSTSAAEVQRVLAEAEARAEAKLSDLRFKIRSLENERNELEEDWANKLQERVRELEKLRRVITEKESEYSESLRSTRDKDDQIKAVEEQKRVLERELIAMEAKVNEVRGDVTLSAEAEVS
jgi:chromosome segregation ATPase